MGRAVLFSVLFGGAVLTGLLRGIDPSLTGIKFGEVSDWEKLAG